MSAGKPHMKRKLITEMLIPRTDIGYTQTQVSVVGVQSAGLKE